jgi:photosystem II stability/assembly factor-like uncharacterized protein
MIFGCKTISLPTRGVRHLLFVSCLALLLHSADAQQMKLLAPGTGWAMRQNSIYWTSDDGEHWTEITPDEGRPLGGLVAEKQAAIPTHPRGWHGLLYSVFFLNQVEGWAVLAPPSPDSDDYKIAHTVDSGKHWSVSDLAYPPLPEWLRDALAGPSAPFFVDPLHGWIFMDFSGNSRPGKLLMTEDGGKTWQWTNSPGETGELFFLSPQRGWIACFGWSEKVFVTKDGAKSWQQVSVPRPEGTEGVQPRMLGAPEFWDDRHGILTADYVFGPSAPTKLAIYDTSDAGDHWQLARVLILESSFDSGIVALAGSAVVIPTASNGAATPSVLILPLRGDGARDLQPSGRNYSGFSFVDSVHGWVWKLGGLFATNDGGHTWRNITPGPRPVPRKGVVVRNGVVAH